MIALVVSFNNSIKIVQKPNPRHTSARDDSLHLSNWIWICQILFASRLVCLFVCCTNLCIYSTFNKQWQTERCEIKPLKTKVLCTHWTQSMNASDCIWFFIKNLTFNTLFLFEFCVKFFIFQHFQCSNGDSTASNKNATFADFIELCHGFTRKHVTSFVTSENFTNLLSTAATASFATSSDWRGS